MTSSVLYQNVDKSVTLLDIPCSIEAAQGFEVEGQKRNLLSSPPIEQSYPSPEPKSTDAATRPGATSIQDLIVQRYQHFALEEIQRALDGAPWCLPRTVRNEGHVNKRRRCGPTSQDDRIISSSDGPVQNAYLEVELAREMYRNATGATHRLGMEHQGATVHIPPRSIFIQGDVENTLPTFLSTAPRFDVIIMDPPWPNRSARRKKSYRIPCNTHSISALLSSIPVNDHLTNNGLVGIWITNKPAFRDLVLGCGGLFEQWGLKLVEEWIWLKVTVSGSPIFRLESTGRKPYEILLLSRKASPDKEPGCDIKRRVIVGVPDLHSRKPNLKLLLEPLLPYKYEALEIFARNLTAGWWAWGNEVLKFQNEQYWTEG